MQTAHDAFELVVLGSTVTQVAETLNMDAQELASCWELLNGPDSMLRSADHNALSQQ